MSHIRLVIRIPDKSRDPSAVVAKNVYYIMSAHISKTLVVGRALSS